jgi:hypothetical protein
LGGVEVKAIKLGFKKDDSGKVLVENRTPASVVKNKVRCFVECDRPYEDELVIAESQGRKFLSGLYCGHNKRPVFEMYHSGCPKGKWMIKCLTKSTNSNIDE